MLSILITMTAILLGCTPQEAAPSLPAITPPTIETPDEPDTPVDSSTIKLTINQAVFTATLTDSQAAAAFYAMLPQTVTMGDLNANEKYYYLPQNLPTDAQRIDMIGSGDLMLFGSNCLVLFYTTFSSSYSYTPIGRIDNTEQLVEAVGKGRVTIKFER